MKNMFQLLLPCCVLILCGSVSRAACSASELGRAYDVTFPQKDVNITLKVAAPAPSGEVWLGANFDSKQQSGPKLNAHIWKLNATGQKVTDVEIKYPESSKATTQNESTIEGLLLSSAGPKIFVNFSDPREFWAIQLNEAGEVREARKIGREMLDILSIQAIRAQETIIRQSSSGIVHLNKDDIIDWKLTLPLKESEYTVAATASDKDFFVATTYAIDEEARTGLYRISDNGKLLQQSSIPEFNVGLSFTSGYLLAFHISASKHSVSAVRLDDQDLHIEREFALPDFQEFVLPIKTTPTEVWLIASRKDSTKIGLLRLNADQQPDSYCPLAFPMKPELLISTLFDINFFAAGAESLFMYSFPNDIANERVVAWALPKK